MGLMPARNLSLTEMFYDYRHPGLLRGTVLAAVSHAMDTKGFEQVNDVPVTNVSRFTFEEFNHLVDFYRSKSWLANAAPKQTREYMYAITAGIPVEVNEFIK